MPKTQSLAPADLFQNTDTALATVQEPAATNLPWVRQWYTSSKNALDVKASIKDIGDGDYYLATSDGEFHRIDAVTFPAARQFWSDTSFEGNEFVQHGITEIDPQDFKSPYKPDIRCMCLVFANGQVYTAMAAFRKAQAPLVQEFVSYLKKSGESWQQTTTGLNVRAKTSKSSGQTYYLGYATPTSLTAKQATALSKWAKDEAKQKERETVENAFTKEVDDLVQQCG